MARRMPKISSTIGFEEKLNIKGLDKNGRA
jgi:hypothetical protein